MALTFITAVTAVESNLQHAFITDKTVYGGPNPQRSELALYGLLFKRDANENDTAIAIDNSDPVNATQWIFNLADNDGWYIFQVWGFGIWAAGTYNQDVGVYYATDGNFYKSTTTTNDVPGTSSEWDLIIDFNDTPSSVPSGQTNNWSSARTEAGPIGDALADFANKIKSGRCQSWSEAGAVLSGAAGVNGAFALFRRGNYVDAQKAIDYLQAQTAATL